MDSSLEDIQLISVVIPHYNGSKRIINCLSSLLSSSKLPLEVIVVDDHSSDGSTDDIKEMFPQVTVVRNAENRGYGYSCNQGFRASKGEYLVFLNDDTSVEDSWDVNLLSSMIQLEARVGTPKILFASDLTLVNAEGGYCDRFGVGINGRNGCLDRYSVLAPHFVFYGSACLAFERGLFQSLGGFDESFYMYSEDVDLCWRAQLLGHKTLYVPSSIVRHAWMGTTNKLSFILTYVSRNSLKTILKNYSTRSLISIVPAYGVMKVVELLYFFFRSRSMAINILSGIRWNMTHLNETLQDRRQIQSTRLASDKEIKKMMRTFSFEVKMLLGSVTSPIRQDVVEIKKEQELQIVLRE